jgi:hypothetical protein
MGHADSHSDMGATYRQYIADERLEKVVRHVYGWLFGPVASGDTSKAGDAQDAIEPELPPAEPGAQNA